MSPKRFSSGLRGDASRLLKRDVAVGERHLQGGSRLTEVAIHKLAVGTGFSSEMLKMGLKPS